MIRRPWLRLAVVVSVGALSAVGLADIVVTAHVDVTGSSSNRAAALPVPGDYRFTFGKFQATVTSPSGKRFVFDFENKTFTSINMAGKTFYQMKIDDVLRVGDKVLPGNKVAGSIEFTPLGAGAFRRRWRLPQ